MFLTDHFFVVAMLLGNKLYTVGKPNFHINSAKFRLLLLLVGDSCLELLVPQVATIRWLIDA